MLKHRVNLKFHINKSFSVKVTNKISLRTFYKMKICHKIGLSVIKVWTIFIKVLTSKMSF